MKTRLELHAELDILNKGEMAGALDDAFSKHTSWEREAAYGMRLQDLPRMYGTIADAGITLGADQPDQPSCGPGQGWYWAVQRISVDGLASGDAVKVFNDTRFVGWITYQPGFITFGKHGLVMKAGDYLRVVGTSLTATGTVNVTGQAVSVPGPLMWKILS